MSFDKYLMDQCPITFQPKLAKALGNSDKAAILQDIHWCICRKDNKNVHNGMRWVYNSYAGWQERFCYLSERSLERHLTDLQKIGLLVCANFNKKNFDKTKWYTIDYDELRSFFTRHGLDVVDEDYMYPNKVKQPQEPNESRWRQFGATMAPNCGDEAANLAPPIPHSSSHSSPEYMKDIYVPVAALPATPVPSLKQKNKTKPSKMVGYTQENVSAAVWEVFRHWTTKCCWSEQRTLLSEKRKVLIEQAIHAYGVEGAKLAIDGIALSPHHMGQNDAKTEYNDIDHIFRSPEKAEGFIKLAEKNKPKLALVKTAKLEATQEEKDAQEGIQVEGLLAQYVHDPLSGLEWIKQTASAKRGTPAKTVIARFTILFEKELNNVQRGAGRT